MPKKAAVRKSTAALKVGWWAAVSLPPGAAPMRCYVGQIQAIDEHGIRLTLVDWISGLPENWDMFIPFKNIESMLVATEEHDVKGFGEPAGKWQQQMEALDKKNKEEEEVEGRENG